MSRNIILVTGGQRSGKSRHGQVLAETMSANPVYVATARLWDEEFEKRVKRHQDERGQQWATVEEEKQLSKLDFGGRTVLLDCITLWLTNIFYDNNFDPTTSLAEAKREWDSFVDQSFTIIAITNEIGMGVIPDNKAGRAFADVQGWMNQHIAAMADSVYLVVSGIPVKIK